MNTTTDRPPIKPPPVAAGNALAQIDHAITVARARLEKLLTAREVMAEFGGTSEVISEPSLSHVTAVPCSCGSHTHDAPAPAKPESPPPFDESDTCRVKVLKVLGAVGPRSAAPLLRLTGSCRATLRSAIDSLSGCGLIRKAPDGVAWEISPAGRDSLDAGDLIPLGGKTGGDLILEALAERGPLPPRDIAAAIGRSVAATHNLVSKLKAAGKIVKPDGRVGTASPWALAGTGAAPMPPAPAPAAPAPPGSRINPDLDSAFNDENDLFMPGRRAVPPPGKAMASPPTRPAAEAGSMSQQVLRLLAVRPMRFMDMKQELRTSVSTLGTALKRLSNKGKVRKQSETDPRSPWELVPLTAAVR